MKLSPSYLLSNPNFTITSGTISSPISTNAHIIIYVCVTNAPHYLLTCTLALIHYNTLVHVPLLIMAISNPVETLLEIQQSTHVTLPKI